MNAPTAHRGRVVAAVVWRDGKALLGQRPQHKGHGGLWEFPGGQIESGETHADAVRRELVEELGVRGTAVGEVLFRHHDPVSGFSIEFVPVLIKGEPVALEHQEIRWLRPEQIALQELAPSDRAFLESGALALMPMSEQKNEVDIG